MADSFTNQDLFTYASAVAAVAAGVVLGLQRVLKNWSSDRKEMNKNSVETDLYQMMSDQTARLHEQNAELGKTIIQLREEMGNLHTEIISLRGENQLLKSEIKLLHEEINFLRSGPQSMFPPTILDND